MRKQSFYLILGTLAALVGLLAVTQQSLWIDEGSAALKAMEPSLGGWWQNLRSEGNSNLQLIGQLFYLWGWEKLLGSSEIALRLSNLPFFVVGVLALAWGMGPGRNRQNAIGLLALTNAFLWYYLSEARPYIVLFGFAAVSAACLFRLLQEPEKSLDSAFWYGLFCLGIVGLCATSLIAVPWALGAIGAAIFWSGPRNLTRCALRFKISSAFLAAGMAALGLYYLWTLQLGARASAVGRTGLFNIGFIFYELLGLAGLGPGRLELRETGATATIAFLPWLALGAGALLVLLGAGFLALRNGLTRRHLIFFVLAVGGPFALVLLAGAAGHMRLVGRHLSPLLPFLLAWLAAGLAVLVSGALWKKLLAAGVLLALLVSALEIRFAPRHRRDDYRAAAALARAAVASGQRIWWLADADTGRYYRVPLDSPLVATSSTAAASPSLVILSKPDIYDAAGEARAYLTRNGFRVERTLPAFQIWQPPPAR